MACLFALSLAILNLLVASVQAAKDPLNDFCRRFGQQTAVVDRKLYINGGMVNWNPLSQNPLNYSNTWFLYNDLTSSVGESGMPQLYANLSMNSTVPQVSGGALWADDVNKVLYLYGGEFDGSPDEFTLWAYDVLLDQWNLTGNSPNNIQRVAWGAGVAVSDVGKGYYLGGYLSSKTEPNWRGSDLATGGLVIYDMERNSWTNNTGPQINGSTLGIAEGSMVYVPASDGGLLVYFGGILDPYMNGTAVPSPMKNIYVYDMASGKWYSQTATGDLPGNRRKFCAGVTWAEDQSSYNIYMYGGAGFGDNATGYDDVYILTLPSFKWIKWWPTAPGSGSPHNSLSCNVIDGAQMLIIGGTFPGSDQCDSTDSWGTHNLNLGKNGPNNAMWDKYQPNISTYLVPDEIISVIGGSPTGSATATVSAWDNRDLGVYFGRKFTPSPRTATRAIPSTTASVTSTSTNSTSNDSNHVGAIAGGAVGGAVVLILILLALLFCLNKLKKRKKAKQEPAELPGSTIPELSSPVVAEPKVPGSPGAQSANPAYGQSYSPAHTGSAAGSPHGTTPAPYTPSQQVPSTPHTPYGSPPPQEAYFATGAGAPPPPGMYPAGAYQQEGYSPTQYSNDQYPPQQYLAPGNPQQPQYQYPYDPNQHTLHHQHFPPPEQPRPVPSPSADTDDTYPPDPPTTSNTPAHFYPQPLNPHARPPSSDSRKMHSRFIEEDD